MHVYFFVYVCVYLYMYAYPVFQQVRSDSCRHLLLTGMSRFLLSKPKQQDLLTV